VGAGRGSETVEGGDDVTWADDVVAALSTPDVGNYCEAGHGSHATKRVSIDTAGPAPIPDWPADPAHLAHKFEMFVYDWEQYADVAGYCPAADSVAHTLDVYRRWEAWESLVVTTILADEVGWVVDLGCQLGWFTLLGASAGHPIVAVDCNPESLIILIRNCALNGYLDVHTVLAWIDKNTPPVPAGERIRFLKADIEGFEAEAVRAFAPSFAAGDVDYALLELSPMLNDTWRDAHDTMVGHGMVAFQIPNKGDDVDEFAADPLGVTLSRPFDPDQPPFDQLNVFFARQDLL
jgi:hypothetical protein